MDKRKIIITLILTLILGFLIGFFTSGRLAKSRMHQRLKMMNNPHAEQELLIRRLSITKEQQKVIAPLIERHVPKQKEIRGKHRSEMESTRIMMFDSMKLYLDQEQIEKLDKMIKRMGPPRSSKR